MLSSTEGFIKFPRYLASLMPSLDEKEVKLLLAIADRTASYGQERASFKYSDLIETTGLHRNSVVYGLKSLRERGIIHSCTIRQEVEAQILYPIDTNFVPHKPQIMCLSTPTLKNKESNKNIYTNIKKESRPKKEGIDFSKYTVGKYAYLNAGGTSHGDNLDNDNPHHPSPDSLPNMAMGVDERQSG